jgi:hypothetical protein
VAAAVPVTAAAAARTGTAQISAMMRLIGPR